MDRRPFGMKLARLFDILQIITATFAAARIRLPKANGPKRIKLQGQTCKIPQHIRLLKFAVLCLTYIKCLSLSRTPFRDNENIRDGSREHQKAVYSAWHHHCIGANQGASNKYCQGSVLQPALKDNGSFLWIPTTPHSCYRQC